MSDKIRRQHRFTITPEHLIHDLRVSPVAFRLWCVLDRYAGEKESAFPSRETLAIRLDVSLATIDRAIKCLTANGWLDKERRAQGDVNLYTLTVAPQKATEKLIEDAYNARVEATQPRRDKATAKRRERKAQNRATVSVHPSANVQVSTGGLVTDDATPDSKGLVTSDKTPLVTGDERGLVTGDGEKEAPLEGGTTEGDSDPSLRSGSADADAPSALPGLPVPAVAERNITHEAFTIAGDFLAWFERERNKGQSVPGRDRTKAALAKSHIAPALEAGATVDQIKRALSKCRIELPSMPEWREQLRIARGGSNVTPLHGRRAYNDAETWGDTKAREQAVADRANLTPEEVAAQIEAAFTPRRNATNAE